MAHEVQAAQDRAPAERSLRELINDLTAQLSRLVRTELLLAKQELTERSKKAGGAIAALAVGGLIALFGFGALIATAVVALDLVLPAWAAVLIIGAALLLLAAMFAVAGVLLLRRQLPPLPKAAIESTRQDVSLLRGAATGSHPSAGTPSRA